MLDLLLFSSLCLCASVLAFLLVLFRCCFLENAIFVMPTVGIPIRHVRLLYATSFAPHQAPLVNNSHGFPACPAQLLTPWTRPPCGLFFWLPLAICTFDVSVHGSIHACLRSTSFLHNAAVSTARELITPSVRMFADIPIQRPHSTCPKHLAACISMREAQEFILCIHLLYALS